MKSICVFCGSSPGARESYREAARAAGAGIAARGLRLIYGGARVGLMGIVANAALEGGGHVVGVLPQVLGTREVLHDGLSELHRVGTMHERKALMSDLADGFVALPGGLGTLEEIAEVATWSYLGIHTKPFGLLNVDGFYDPLLAFLDRAVDDGFIRPETRATVLVEADAARLLDRIAAACVPGAP